MMKEMHEKFPVKSSQWWKAKDLGREPHEILDLVVKQIEDDQQGRYEAYKEYERLFGNTQYGYGDDILRAISSDTLSQNELQNTIETLWAQIFKNRVVPAISVSESDWDEWDRARSYSRWLEGAFDDTGVYEEVFPQAGIHFLQHGTGIIRVGWKEDYSGCDTEDSEEESDEPSEQSSKQKLAKVYCWAVNPKYVLVDRLEAKHGKPRSIYFKDHVDRWVLFDTYKEEREDFYGTCEERCTGVYKCSGNDDLDLGAQSSNRCDMLTVREAFHLPSTPKSKDGRHVIWVKGCTLVDEQYDWDRFPAVFMRFGPRTEGFWGESAVKRLAPTQKNLDKLNNKIDQAQDVMGVPRILVGNNGNGIKLAHIDDIPGGIIQCNNINQVRDWNAQSASSELYQDRDGAARKMRALLGISDFEGTQNIPQGMRDVSGAMLERWVDQGAARHAMSHAEYENAVQGLAYLYMLQAEECQEMGYDVVAASPSASNVKSSMESLKFSEVCVDRRRLKLKVQSMSQLPTTFAGKVEAIEKLKNAGQPLNPKTAQRMLEIPDPTGASDMMAGSEEIIFKNLCHMCRTGEYLAPLPFDDLDLIVRMTTDYINWYRVRKDADYEKIGLLSQYIDDAVELKKGLGGPDPNVPPDLSAPPGAPGADALGMGAPQMGPPGTGAPPMQEPPGAPMGGQPPVPQIPEMGQGPTQGMGQGPPGMTSGMMPGGM